MSAQIRHSKKNKSVGWSDGYWKESWRISLFNRKNVEHNYYFSLGFQDRTKGAYQPLMSYNL